MCHEDKLAAAFAFRSLATGELQSHCRSCHAAYRRQHYLDNREAYITREVARINGYRMQNRALILEYLATHPCVDCGETDPVVLEFDHRDRETKTAAVSILAATRSWQRVLAEIATCDVRCVTCHRRRTARQFGWLKLSLPAQVEVALAQAEIDDDARSDELRECVRCHRGLPVAMFWLKNRRTGRRSRTCRDCAATYGREHYRKNKAAYLARNRSRDRRGQRTRELRSSRLLVVRYLLQHPCIDCGETDPLLLEFDHRDPSTKLAYVATLIGHGPREALLEEIAKCDVRCVRCHRLKTARQSGWSRIGEDVTMYVYAGVA